MGKLRTRSAGILAVLLVWMVGVETAAACAAWESFKSRFVSENGRVIDTANGDISHSEGQGYGLLLAAAYEDAGAFARLFAWTHANLMIRSDGLLVWQYKPGDQRFPDANSASDGDVLVAFALLVAGEKFDNARYTRLGRELAGRVRETLVREVGGYTVLLPGPEGFVRDDGSVVINLSYWVFPALTRFTELPGGDTWQALAADGRRLLRKARFGTWDLPPDWAVLRPDGSVHLPDGDAFEPVFGYNAVRIPLYLAWADGAARDDLLRPFRAFWSQTATPDSIPLVVDLARNDIRDRGANPGFEAIRALVARERRGPSGGAATAGERGTHYYDAVLALLACEAAADGGSACACGN